MGQIRALILTGYGINCERDMAFACQLAGGAATVLHAKELFTHRVSLDEYHLLCFPGGFSFGDELGASKAFANRLQYASKLKEDLLQFVQRGKCIIGICNGFQLLVKLGLLPQGQKQTASLTANDSGKFENRWVHHKVCRSPCIFTKNQQEIYLPVRHGEGKFVLQDPWTIEELFANRQVVLQYAGPSGEPTQQYPHNPNGSERAIAGLCDPTGRIFGMMAHPEAALLSSHHPHWHRLKEEARRMNIKLSKYGPGFPLFQNAIQYLKENQ